jgi:hypothetical protein
MRQCAQRMGDRRGCLVSAIFYNADGSLSLLVSQACGLVYGRGFEPFVAMYRRAGVPYCVTQNLQALDFESSRVPQKRKLRMEAGEFGVYRNVRIRFEESPIASSSVVPSREPHTKAEMRKCKFCVLCFTNVEDCRHHEEERTCYHSLHPSHSIYHRNLSIMIGHCRWN